MSAFLLPALLLITLAPLTAVEVGAEAGEATPVVTVLKAGWAPDGDWVVMEGTLVVREDAPERYHLRDDTGTIEIELDRELLRETGVAAGDRIRVRGTIDIEVEQRTIVVDQVHAVS